MGAAPLKARRWAAAEGAASVLVRLIALAIVVLALSGCATSRSVHRTQMLLATEAELAVALEKGFELYGTGEYGLAAAQFELAAEHATTLSEDEIVWEVTAAACISWMRARRLPPFSACTERLESLQRRHGTSDIGLNVLMGFGALASHRPMPSLAIPPSVAVVLRAAFEEAQP
jgi:hypothetical protein